jgi:hypothetical protein
MELLMYNNYKEKFIKTHKTFSGNSFEKSFVTFLKKIPWISKIDDFIIGTFDV